MLHNPSVDSGDDPVADNLAVLFPVLAVLAVTLVVVTALAVDEEDGKVQDVKVGDEHAPSLGLPLDNLSAIPHHERPLDLGTGAQDLVAGETSGQAVGPRLDPVAEVVDVSGNSPPARNEKLATLLGLDVLELRHLGIVGVGSEVVLLAVGRAEDVEAKTNEGQHHGKTNRAE